ncbi:MAG: hypothetical protein MUO76_09840 [Anaerolineaceae bacterium]|nr:hypothetical protein [Anaerolineaceae bacterium]
MARKRINKILRWFNPRPPKQAQYPMMEPEFAVKIAMQIEKTQEKEYSCDEVFEILDQFVELANKGEDTASLMPLVQRHIEMCRDCFDEYELLLAILRELPA